MTTKIIAMVTVLASIAMLTGLVATTTPITAAYADKNERESNLKCKGSGTATGQSSADNFISCEQGSEGIGGQPGSD